MSATGIQRSVESGHRLRGLRILPQVIVYVLLFLGAFEGIRRAPAVASLAALRGGYDGVVILGLAVGLAVFGLLCSILFLTVYLAWRASRPSAVFAVSLGLYAWMLLMGLNLVWIVKSLARDIGSPEKTFSFVLPEVSTVIYGGCLVFLCGAMLRRPRQTSPGAKLDRATQPRLWKILESTAAECGVRLPETVYWISNPNAQAMKIGGWLGIGGKPAIAIGLPLLRVLHVDELRATLAHEFHHLRRGDAFLFGCVFRARQSAESLQAGFGDLPKAFAGTGSVTFFQTYSWFLWQLAKPIIRNWEFESDAFAARTVSAGSLARALIKLDFAQSRFDSFRRNWLVPALESGYLPPAMGGFWDYYEHRAMEERNHNRLITAREANRQSETHPALRERLLRLAEFGSLSDESPDTPAFLLIDEPGELEAKVYAPEAVARTEAVWSTEVLRKLMSLWEREVAASAARRQQSLDVNSLPAICSSLPSAATLLGHEKSASETVERILMKAFAVALNNHGWEPALERGRLVFSRNGLSVDPAAELLRLKMRQAADWLERCEEWDISGVLLLSEPQLPDRGRFCNRCFRTFATVVERCPNCLKRLVD